MTSGSVGDHPMMDRNGAFFWGASLSIEKTIVQYLKKSNPTDPTGTSFCRPGTLCSLLRLLVVLELGVHVHFVRREHDLVLLQFFPEFFPGRGLFVLEWSSSFNYDSKTSAEKLSQKFRYDNTLPRMHDDQLLLDDRRLTRTDDRQRDAH